MDSIESFRIWVSDSYFELSDKFHNVRQRLLSIGSCNVLISSFIKQSLQSMHRTPGTNRVVRVSTTRFRYYPGFIIPRFGTGILWSTCSYL
ncbi:unnamed protein product [Rotaria socialis]